MRRCSVLLLILSAGWASAASPAVAQQVLLDRIAIVVNKQAIKDSDIERDLRVTEFLNRASLDVSLAARKQAASRLIDQALIRREIRLMEYPPANLQQVQKMLEQVRKRYRTEAAYTAALGRYGITASELHKELEWQMTVLNFIDQRFRPAVLVSDADVQQYYDQHRAQFGGRTLEDVRGQVEQQLTGERVNQQFFAWLEQARKDATIDYLEPDLK